MKLINTYSGGFGLIHINADIDFLTLIFRTDYICLMVLWFGFIIDFQDKCFSVTIPERHGVSDVVLIRWGNDKTA